MRCHEVVAGADPLSAKLISHASPTNKLYAKIPQISRHFGTGWYLLVGRIQRHIHRPDRHQRSRAERPEQHRVISIDCVQNKKLICPKMPRGAPLQLQQQSLGGIYGILGQLYGHESCTSGRIGHEVQNASKGRTLVRSLVTDSLSVHCPLPFSLSSSLMHTASAVLDQIGPAAD